MQRLQENRARDVLWVVDERLLLRGFYSNHTMIRIVLLWRLSGLRTEAEGHTKADGWSVSILRCGALIPL